MRDVLLELRRQGKTLVLSSHQMETVERLCDRVALLDRGEKLLDGTVGRREARATGPTRSRSPTRATAPSSRACRASLRADRPRPVRRAAPRRRSRPAGDPARRRRPAARAPLRDRRAEPARHLRRAGDAPRRSGGVRLFAIVRREYLERVRSKAFLIGTLLGPLLMAGFTIGPSVLMARQRGKPLRVAVLDASGALREAGRAGARASGASPASRASSSSRPRTARPTSCARCSRPRSWRAASTATCTCRPTRWTRSTAEYYGKNVSNVMDLGLLDKAVEDADRGLPAHRRRPARGAHPGTDAAARAQDDPRQRDR